MCTNIGATGASVRGGSKVYFGSVSDDPYDIRTRVIVEREEGGHAFVGTDLVPLEANGSAADYRDSVSGAPTRGLNEKRARLYLGARLRAAGETPLPKGRSSRMICGGA